MGEKVQVLVRTVSGKTIAMYVDKQWTAGELASVIAGAEDGGCIKTTEIRILHNGKPIGAGKTLHEADIQQRSYVQVTLRARGGSLQSIIKKECEEVCKALDELKKALEEGCR